MKGVGWYEDFLFIDLYAVFNKVEGEEFESEVETWKGSSFSRRFGKKRPIMVLWPLVSLVSFICCFSSASRPYNAL